MTNDDYIPDLLEQYMTETRASCQWITVRELRQYFQLPNEYAHPLSGFLLRLYTRKPNQFPYIVSRIEREKRTNVTGTYNLRYYVQQKEDR